MPIEDLLITLKARLPELQWHFNKPGIIISPKVIPRGIFSRLTTEPTHYLDEIKWDIERLSHQKDKQAAHHLAKKIHEKINILVKICCYQRKMSKATLQPSVGIEFLSSRQERIASILHEIDALNLQIQALDNALSNCQCSTRRLNLLREVGEAEKKITLLKEDYAKICA